MNVRAIAAQIIYEVTQEGRSLSDALKKMSQTSPKDQSFMRALCFGVCRWYFRLDAIAQLLLEKPLKQKDQDIYILILLGLYQLIDMRIPDYAAVGETVAAAKTFKKIWAKNLINGVLRQYQRNADELQRAIENDFAAKYSVPTWLLDKIKSDWPQDWQSILLASNQHPPFSLRVNQQRHSREEYLQKLSGAISIPETQAGIILENAIEVTALPGFSDGQVSVQDGAAQLAAELLMLEPGQRVLDACAAPGGKAAHILESCPQVSELIAIDCDDRRLDSVKDNLQRLKLSAQCICADVGDVKSWWDGKLFDRILLDAPCSASGVIRRHPDIKLLRRDTDIALLAEEQARILNNIWQILKPGGMLLYATCSIFHMENDLIIKSFLETHADAREEKINSTWGKDCFVGKQILPGMHNMDGFYYARIKKH